jgi:CRISPR-associated exonuclease Cas4
VKNAGDEFNAKGKSVFNQLLTNVINEMSSSNTEYRDVKERIKELTLTLNKRIADGSPNTRRPEQITALEALLEGELSNWNTSIEIEITLRRLMKYIRVGTNVWVNDGIQTDVNRKGTWSATVINLCSN